MFWGLFINSIFSYKILNVAFIEKRGKERQATMNPTIFALTGDLQLLKEESQIVSGRFNLASIF